jgi:probable F420-dependent oxidoreductase
VELTACELWATTPETMDLRAIGAHAARAEALGFDGLQVPDAVHDGLLLATIALNATRRLRVMTAVLVAFPRSPMNVALAAWDLAALSGGRFALGLGTQVKANIEQRYSTIWSAPVARMREYAGALRAIFAAFQHGVPLDFRGEHYRFTRLQPFFNPGPIAHPHIPLLLGAVGPQMTALAGEIADGMITHPTNTPPRYLREIVLPRLREGAARGGRGLDEFALVLNAPVASGVDRDAVQRERERWRRLLGFLYSTPSYWPSLELLGFGGRGEQLLAMSRANRWEEMGAVLDDALLDCVVPAASFAELPELLHGWYGGQSMRLALSLPEDSAHDAAMAEMIAALKRRP